MQIGMRQFGEQTVTWFERAVKSGSYSRSTLAAESVRRDGWVNARGAPCRASAAKALPRLAEALGPELPSPRSGPKGRRTEREAFPDTAVDAELPDLGQVSLVEVEPGEDGRRFAAMMAGHHPQGEACHYILVNSISRPCYPAALTTDK